MPEKLSQAMKDLIDILNARKVQYLVIEAHALGVHAQPRATKDRARPRSLTARSPNDYVRCSTAIRAGRFDSPGTGRFTLPRARTEARPPGDPTRN
jgi:hypothetical protein